MELKEMRSSWEYNSSIDERSQVDVEVSDRARQMLSSGAPVPSSDQAPWQFRTSKLNRLDSAPPKSIHEQQQEKERERGQDPFGHLPEDEAAILRRQLDLAQVNVTYISLYRYATRLDLIIMLVSGICAIAGGAAPPLMTVVFGSLTGEFQGFFLGTTTKDEFLHTIGHLTLYFVYLGLGQFVTLYVSTVGFIYTGEHMAGKIRQQYLASIMRQNIAYFDKLGAGEITTRITADTDLVMDGMSGKVGLTLQSTSTFIVAYVIGYIKFWKLTLILTSAIVAIFLTMAVIGRHIVKWGKESFIAYGAGGTVAEEVISSIRNAVAFGTQEKLAKEYDKHLMAAEYAGFRMKILSGSMVGFLMCYIYLTYSLSFWLGSHYLTSGQCTLQDIITILLSIMIGAFALGGVAPNVQAFTTAVAAAGKIFSTIERVSPLDPTSGKGRIPETLEGTVELRNIKHIYPSRPEVVVMEDVSLVVPAGKTTALVGASGSGKSTIVGLVERFYDPVRGEVLLDGINVQELNLKWLRQRISLVSQEPTLFATTIAGNIRHGLIGTPYEHLPEEKVIPLIENAAKLSNAHDFISALPEGYDTHVGDRGFLLSGGQKQRVAIARAIVSDPQILLLDEATSALDTKSEGAVQAALDTASQGRTTIVIAHRLSTIRDADNIVVMSSGRIFEQGTHNELLERRAAYYNLVEAQRISAETEQKREDEELQEDDHNNMLEKLPTEKMADESDGSQNDFVARTKSRFSILSASSQIVANYKPASESKHSLWALIKVIASFNKPETMIMLLGLLTAIICGGGNPTQAVFFAKSISSLALPAAFYDKLRSDANFWSWMFFMLAMVTLAAYFIQAVAFAWCSEKLIRRSRDTAFRTMLRQDIGFFDKQENSAGALTSFLSTETTRLSGLSGITLGTIIQILTTLIAGFIVSLSIGWKLALVCISTVPVVLGCGFFRFHMLTRFQARAKKAYEGSASYACEATSAIRTVASLTREEDVLSVYKRQLDEQGGKSLRSVAVSSTLLAAAQSLMMGCIALGFWYGGTLIANREYDMFQFFLCFASVIFGAQSAGTVFTFAPDMSKAKHAAAEMKTLMDRKPEIDTWSTEGETLESMVGNIEFRDVHFRYPTRLQQAVLRGVDLDVKPGQYVALVGASGCGKSTTIALLERFYDPLVGGIRVDGKEISTLNVNTYRRHIALVSQEPTLYQGTIRENILLGADTLPEDVPESSIVQACQDANIYEFIVSLPEGFDTVVGSKGSMLSGGQKQRIAIARALLRNPKILLLDEATSALDSESEKVVQAALDKAAKGRTTIAVAHRLSTIKKADMIYVFDAGRIVENGTHRELIEKRGRYFELVKMQSLGKTQ